MPKNIECAEYEYRVPQHLIDQYSRDGVVLIEQPFESSWIDRLLEEYQRIVTDWHAGSKAFPVHDRNGSMGIQNVILRSAVYRDWAINSPITEIVAQVIQSDSLRFYFDNFFVKHGDRQETATPLHQDVPAFGFQGAQLPSAWLALTDVDMDNAPLVTALGSHKNQSFMFRSPAQKPGLELLPGYREPSEIPAYLEENNYEIKAWPAKKGDLIIVCPYTIHGAMQRKATAGKRIGFSSRWIGDDVRWHGTIYNEVEASTHTRVLKDGELPPEEIMPIIWHRKTGNLARVDGRFTSHITLEPKENMDTAIKVSDLNTTFSES